MFYSDMTAQVLHWICLWDERALAVVVLPLCVPVCLSYIDGQYCWPLKNVGTTEQQSKEIFIAWINAMVRNNCTKVKVSRDNNGDDLEGNVVYWSPEGDCSIYWIPGVGSSMCWKQCFCREIPCHHWQWVQNEYHPIPSGAILLNKLHCIWITFLLLNYDEWWSFISKKICWF